MFLSKSGQSHVCILHNVNYHNDLTNYSLCKPTTVEKIDCYDIYSSACATSNLQQSKQNDTGERKRTTEMTTD